MNWFKLPKSILGGDYVLIPLFIGDRGPFWFLVDTGLTTNLLIPQICKELGIIPRDNGVRGMGGDGNLNVLTTTVAGVSIDGKIPVPRFTAAVIDFPQRKFARKTDVEISGMVGMQFLEQFDVKYEQDRLEVFRANEGLEAHLPLANWTLVKGILMPARLMACQITIDDHKAPFLGLIDSGASHSIMNKAAAKALGYRLSDPALRSGPSVSGFGIMGKEVRMPLVPAKVALSSFVDNVTLLNNFLGAWWLSPMENRGDGVEYEQEADVAIGEMNLAALTRLSERGLGSYKGPMVLTGQDVLAQRDVLYNGDGKRMLIGQPNGRQINI
eukprot:EG_transcript_11933